MADIDHDSPPGAWRAALDPNATCAICHRRVCTHPDVEYLGLAKASAEEAEGRN